MLKITSVPISSIFSWVLTPSNSLQQWNFGWCFEGKRPYNPHVHVKNTNTVMMVNNFHLHWMHEVKMFWENEWTWLLLQKYIFYLMQDRSGLENSKQASQATKILLVSLFDFYIVHTSLSLSLALHFRWSSLSTSTSWYLAVHCLLAWESSAYKSAMLSFKFTMLIFVSYFRSLLSQNSS